MAQQDDFIRTALRVPPALHKALHESASAANRTFNAEILARLQASFDTAPGEATAALLDQIRELEKKTTQQKLSLIQANNETWRANITLLQMVRLVPTKSIQNDARLFSVVTELQSNADKMLTAGLEKMLVDAGEVQTVVRKRIKDRE